MLKTLMIATLAVLATAAPRVSRGSRGSILERPDCTTDWLDAGGVECTFLTLNNRREDCCVNNGDSAIDIAVNDSLEDVADIKEAVCVGDQTLEYGQCIDPDCSVDGQSPIEGVCVCADDYEVSPVTGACFACPTGQVFGDIEGVCVCTNNCGCPSDKKFNFVDGSCVSFVTDGGFESYAEESIGWPNTPSQTPWRHEGFFYIADYFGALSGYLRNGASIEQTVSGLVVGRKYSVSWVQRGWGSRTDNILVSIKGADVEKEIYSNDGVSSGAWVPETSDEFVAESVEVVLKFKNVNMSAYADRAFIDNVTFNLVG